MPTIDISEAPEWVERVGVGWREAAIRGCYSAALRGVQMIVGMIIPSRTPEPTDRGVYRAGWRAHPDPDGATIENLEPVAILIEEGVRASNVKAGTAMLTALAEWAERKGLATKGDGLRLAWAIATNMKKRGIFNRGGIPGLGILRELLDKYENLPTILREEIEREMAAVEG